MDALEETERVQTIIRTLMDVAQGESGLMPLNLQPTALDSLVANVVDLYEHIAEEKEIEIATEIAEPASLPLDAARMRQAFANLLDNAIKYTPLLRRGMPVTIFREHN